MTVLRDGKYVGTDAIEDTDKNQLIRQMVGRTLTEVFPERKNKRGEKVLEIEHLCGNGLEDISLEAYSGEILGLAGLVGAGRTQLAELLFGVKRPRSGKILVRGQEVKLKSPSEAIKTGISLVPEDRKQQGVLLDMSVSDNIIIPGIRKISRGTLVNKRKAKQIVQKHIEDLKIKTPNSAQTVKNLSGGNQQKVVLAKWLAIDPDIIIFDEPTRGIDVGAKHEIYLLMTQLAEQGKTILMITSEMEELLGMADRILVLSEGRLTGMLSGDEIEQERVLALASKNIQEENLAYENA